VSSESSPIVPYWHIWTDADGIRHQSPSALTEFHKAPIQPAAAPQWIGAQTRHNATACARYTGYRFPAEVTIPIAISTAWLVDARYARIK